MNRFFVPTQSFDNDRVLFPAEISHQIERVLRLKAGDRVIVLDNRGMEYEVSLVQFGRGEVMGEVFDRYPARGEPPVCLTLFACLTQREKFEWVLQKCTEVGVSAFVPVISSRSLVQSGVELKMDRWKKIIREAAEQSGRGLIPELYPTQRYGDALQMGVRQNDLCLLAWEGEKPQSLRGQLVNRSPNLKAGILIGPEGGISEDEAILAASEGWKTVSLGKRILRMETAAVVACALIVEAAEFPEENKG